MALVEERGAEPQWEQEPQRSGDFGTAGSIGRRSSSDEEEAWSPSDGRQASPGVRRRQPREDRRPASIYDPDAIKKCGHCQDMKPCIQFSADASRGDGLRGWCKLCEAEARSSRYKKRKAAAAATSAARRRLEQPLGGLQQFHGGLTPPSADATAYAALMLQHRSGPSAQQAPPPTSSLHHHLAALQQRTLYSQPQPAQAGRGPYSGVSIKPDPAHDAQQEALVASWQHQQEQQRQHLQHQHQRAQLQDSHAAQQDALLNALRQREGVEAYLRAQAAAEPGGAQSPAARALTAAILQERLALFAAQSEAASQQQAANQQQHHQLSWLHAQTQLPASAAGHFDEARRQHHLLSSPTARGVQSAQLQLQQRLQELHDAAVAGEGQGSGGVNPELLAAYLAAIAGGGVQAPQGPQRLRLPESPMSPHRSGSHHTPQHTLHAQAHPASPDAARRVWTASSGHAGGSMVLTEAQFREASAGPQPDGSPPPPVSPAARPKLKSLQRRHHQMPELQTASSLPGDSELAAIESLAVLKHGSPDLGRAGRKRRSRDRSPPSRRRAAAAEEGSAMLWRFSGNSEQSSDTRSAVAAEAVSPPTSRVARRRTGRVLHDDEPSAPLPPCDQPCIPRRKRSQATAAPPAAVATASRAIDHVAASPAPPQGGVAPAGFQMPLVPSPRSGAQPDAQQLLQHLSPADKLAADRLLAQQLAFPQRPQAHQQTSQQWQLWAAQQAHQHQHQHHQQQQHHHHQQQQQQQQHDQATLSTTLQLHALLQHTDPASREYIVNSLHLLGAAPGPVRQL